MAKNKRLRNGMKQVLISVFLLYFCTLMFNVGFASNVVLSPSPSISYELSYKEFCILGVLRKMRETEKRIGKEKMSEYLDKKIMFQFEIKQEKITDEFVLSYMGAVINTCIKCAQSDPGWEYLCLDRW